MIIHFKNPRIMKAILLFTCLLFLSAGALMAQSKGQSTKYRLFPDFDADIIRLQKNQASSVDVKQKNARSTKELIFTDYKTQQSVNRPAVNTDARKAPGSKVPSEMTPAELAQQQEALKKAAITTPPPATQQSEAPKQ